MENRPVTAFILTMLGGLFVLLGTLVGVVFTPTYSSPYYGIPTYYYPFLLMSGVSGAIVLLAAVLLYMRPELHVAWGITALVLSVAASIGSVTGYFALFGIVGVVFGVIGGAMAIAWKSVSWAPAAVGGAVRMCSGCGRYIPVAYPYCAYCGTPAPMFRPPGGGPGQQPPGTPP